MSSSKSDFKIVFLDASTVDLGDLQVSRLKRQGRYLSYSNTEPHQIVHRAKNADIIVTNKCVFGRSELAQLPKLKLICVAATGVNNVDLETAKKSGIAVTNVKNYSTQTVAEHTLLFLLSFSHRLLDHRDSVVRGEWSRSPHFTLLDFPFSDLAGKTLGIIGYGAIGRKVARLATALQMKILVLKFPGRKYSARPKRVSLLQLLRQSDYVTLHCPLTKETHHLIHSQNLRLFRKSAVLLNLARGPVVDEKAVARALRKGRLRGYGADVLATEPPPQGHPLLAKSLSRKILLTPHVAWASRESRQHLLDEIASNIQVFRSGRSRNRIA